MFSTGAPTSPEVDHFWNCSRVWVSRSWASIFGGEISAARDGNKRLQGLEACQPSALHPAKAHHSYPPKNAYISYIYIDIIYIYIHRQISTCIHTYIHACMHACMHTYIHTYMYININMNVNINVYIDAYTNMYTHIYMYIYT